MLTEEEKTTVQELKAQGYTSSQIASHLGAKRLNATSSIDEAKLKAFRATDNKPTSNKIAEGLGFGSAVDTFGSMMARRGIGTDVDPSIVQQYVEEPSMRQKVGAGLQVGSLLVPGGAGANLTRQIATGVAAGYLYDVGSDLAQGKSNAEALTPGAGTAVGLAVPPILRAGSSLLRTGSQSLSKVPGQVSQMSSRVADMASDTVPQGVKQVASEALERVPRAISRGKTALEEAAVRSQRIETATPAVQNAIKSKLDDVLIGAVEQADDATRQSYKKMVELAEAPRTGLRPATRPESVAGDVVSEQYKILNKTRQQVGAEIGEAVDKLSTKGAVDVLPAQRQMRDVLRVNGILPDQSGKLNFTGSALTPKQQTLVQQLYDISAQSEQMTPRQIYNMDRVFSQLQREARFDGLDNIYLSTPDGDINAFRAFRNIYSNHLDQIAPEIAPLNKQYAQLRNLQDDIEDSIVKRGGFESNRDVDPSEFAQTNLRRIFSDAQSAADYRALADKLDALARAGGYEGANPQDLAGFAQRLRQIYPETVPETSFQGGITGGIKNVIGKIFDAGAPDVVDQQKALKELLDSFNSGATPELEAGVRKTLKLANESKPYIDAEIDKVIKQVPGTRPAYAPIKSFERSLQKVVDEKSGDLSKLRDAARNTIIVDTPEARTRVIELMRQRTDIERFKVQKPEDFMGYEGAIFNIKTPNGLIAETQVVSPKMTYGKNTEDFSRDVLGDELFEKIRKETGLEPGLGHTYYETYRTMSLADKMGDKGQELLKLSFDYYSKLR